MDLAEKITNGYYFRKFPLVKDLVSQTLYPVEVAVIGSVSRENVGDMSLSRAVQSTLLKSGVRAGIQSLGGGVFGLATFPKRKAIVAGGTIGREAHMRRLAERYGDNPDQLAITGIAMWSIDKLSEESIKLLKSVSFISCRNRNDVNKLRDIGVTRVQFAFDNTFALSTKSYSKHEKRLGINTVSRGMKWNGKEYIPSMGKQFGEKYTQSLRCIVNDYSKRGWEITHVPFTKDDERFASWVFQKLPVDLCPYDFRVPPTYRNVAQCSRFIGTRYHSHIFALKAQVPLLSLSYAPKCRLLKQDLDIPDKLQATREEVIHSEKQVVKRFLNEKGFVLSNERLSDLEKSVRDNILLALHAIS